jgi:ABC-type glycerol-3-phosphate transport system substrate-binding protein
MKKKIVMLSGILALMFVVSGCGGASGSTSSSNADDGKAPVETPVVLGGTPVTKYVSGVQGLSNLLDSKPIPATPEQ